MPQWLKALTAVFLVAVTAYGGNRVLSIYADLNTAEPHVGVLAESIRPKTKVPSCDASQRVHVYNKRLVGCIPANWGEPKPGATLTGLAGSYSVTWTRKGVTASGSTLALQEGFTEADLTIAERLRTISSLTQCRALVGICDSHAGSEGFTLLSGTYEFSDGRPSHTFVLVLPNALQREDPRNMVLSSPTQGLQELLLAAKTVILR